MGEGLEQVSDAVLVVAIGRWRQEALAEAYRRHAGAVLALARRLLASREEAEEVVQDVFLRLWNAPDRFDPERGSLRSYLLAMTHGRSIDRIRSDTSRRAREQRDARRTATGGYDLEHEVADLVNAEQVRSALAVLTEHEREAIQLAYFGGHTYAEVATMLQTPPGTVKGRMRSALSKLRRELVATGMVAQ